jgi:hypothetical protein
MRIVEDRMDNVGKEYIARYRIDPENDPAYDQTLAKNRVVSNFFTYLRGGLSNLESKELAEKCYLLDTLDTKTKLEDLQEVLAYKGIKNISFQVQKGTRSRPQTITHITFDRNAINRWADSLGQYISEKFKEYPGPVVSKDIKFLNVQSFKVFKPGRCIGMGMFDGRKHKAVPVKCYSETDFYRLRDSMSAVLRFGLTADCHLMHEGDKIKCIKLINYKGIAKQLPKDDGLLL